MEQVDTSGMPPVIYALITKPFEQVVVFRTGKPTANAAEAFEEAGRHWSMRWSHWGRVRAQHDEKGETRYFLTALVRGELCVQGHVLLDQSGKYNGSGGGGMDRIIDWVTDLRGVGFRWRQQLEAAIENQQLIAARAREDQLFLHESLELFSEFPYSAGVV